MNKCDARLAASVLYRTSAGNKTAEDAEDRLNNLCEPLRTLLLITKKIPNLIPEDNKKVSETSSNQIKDP